MKYHQNLGTTEACEKRMIEEMKGLDQRKHKVAIKDFFFLEVGLPQRDQMKL